MQKLLTESDVERQRRNCYDRPLYENDTDGDRAISGLALDPRLRFADSRRGNAESNLVRKGHGIHTRGTGPAFNI